MQVKKFILMTIFLFGSMGIEAQKLTLDAAVSVLTIAPGHEELFAAFGHSAIYIKDPALGLDKVYNYGTYYFNQPNFYLNFVRGYLLYGLSVTKYQRFQAYYAYFNREVKSQVLNLTPAQKQKVFDYLENNAKPENSMYYYDYYYNNCATKIRDVFVEVLGEDVKIAESYTEIPGKTFRLLNNDYIEQEFPWGKLGIDLCLGLPIDKIASDYEYMFLPDYIYEGFEFAQIKNDSIWNPLVLKENILLASRPMEYPIPWFTPPIAFSIALVFGIIMLWLQVNKGWLFRWFDFLLFLIIGLVGMLLFLLWIATDHHAAANNFNLLWAIPTHLVLAFALQRKQSTPWVHWYLVITIVVSVVLIILWKLIPQDLNEGFIPIVALIVVRAIAILKR